MDKVKNITSIRKLYYFSTILLLCTTPLFAEITDLVDLMEKSCPATKHVAQKLTPASIFKSVFIRYSPQHSALGLPDIRPFTLKQIFALFDLLSEHGIIDHEYNLNTIIRMTQAKEPAKLTDEQKKQTTSWFRDESSEPLPEKICQDNHDLKNATIKALYNMGMYSSHFPAAIHHDYTFFLGGSIQDMQLRLLTILSIYSTYKNDPRFSFGAIVVITCDRQIMATPWELDSDKVDLIFDKTSTIIRSAIGPTKIIDVVETSFEETVDINSMTEADAFKAMFHSLHKICSDHDFFQKIRTSVKGYHSVLPVDTLTDNSFEQNIYKKTNDLYQFNDNFPALVCMFLESHSNPTIHISQQYKYGAQKIDRPTTKETVKNFLNDKKMLTRCDCKENCHIMAVSNAPHIIYQHEAVLQALEEHWVGLYDRIHHISLSLSDQSNLTVIQMLTKELEGLNSTMMSFPNTRSYILSTVGSGASTNIPTDWLLDNLTKLIFLGARRPKR